MIAVVVDVQIVVVQIVVVLEIVAGFDHAPYFDFAFVESKIVASVAVCETVVKVAVCDFVASVEDFASVYFAVYEIAKEVAGYGIEVTVAACDFAE